ncbi:MAG: chitobiase/beta-hexosaminidase C-terminal domain-containing protein, partial [Limisphaerales bacterium]
IPPGGLFTNSVQAVLINNLGGSQLRYTLDGTAPTATSPLYGDGITITQRTEVRAQAFLSGFPITGASTNALFERVYAVNDGVPNTWRFQYFGPGYVTDPRVGAAEDPDGDGSTNYEEYLAGTHPLDPLSGFALTIRLLPELRWEGVANARYSVLRRDSLSGTNVTKIGEVTGTNRVAVYLDQNRPLPEGYYLLQLAP